MGFAARWSLPFLQEISGLRNNGEFFAYSSGQSYAEHQSTKGSCSPSHQGRLKLRVENVYNQLQTILESSMSDVLTWTLTPSPNEEPLHLVKNPFAYRRTPSPNGEPLHLKKNPFSYTEANRLKVHTVAFSEVLLSRLCRLLLSRMSTPWRVLHRRLVASRQSPPLAQRLLASR